MIKYILQNGLAGVFGTAVTVLAVTLEILMALWAAGKFDIAKWKVAVVFPARLLICMVASPLIYWMEKGFKDYGGGALTRIYIYLPLLMYPIWRLLKIEQRKARDLLAIHFAAFQAPVHLGCIFTSCCNGYESSFGIWNETLQRYTFPVQIFDTVTSIGILVALVYIARKKNYRPNGILYPILLILHGADRFFWEFLRDNRKILLGLSPLSLHALFMMAVGGAWLFLLVCDNRERAARLERKERRVHSSSGRRKKKKAR